MELLERYAPLIIGVAVVLILLKVGLKELEARMGGHTWLRWVVFAVRVVLGLVLAYALSGILRWLTSLEGPAAIAGQMGAIISLILGWHAIYLLVGLTRDVADGKPDKDAMKGALWIPALLPVGFVAAWGLIQQAFSGPPDLGTGLVAAIMAVHTVAYCVMITKVALKPSKHPKAWRWFCVPVNLLGGLVAAVLVAYVDNVLSDHLPAGLMAALRIIFGTLGVAFILKALADIADRQPDQHVRRALLAGVPLVYLLGSGAIAWISDSATSGVGLLPGVSA